MQFTIENINYKFIPSHQISIDNITKKKLLLENDAFKKYDANIEINGDLIECNDITKMKKFNRKVIQETYEEYLQILQERDLNKDKWIYNIIDGNAEQDKILYRDDKCIVIPTYTWNSHDVNKLHILCIPLDKELRTIRTLDASHILLLQHMKRVSLFIIKHLYGLLEEDLKIFFHYEPSTYHLHIHFVNIRVDEGSSVEYSHELDNVMFNLFVCGDYYKKCIMKKRV